VRDLDYFDRNVRIDARGILSLVRFACLLVSLERVTALAVLGRDLVAE
jgi:hypothetical protein